MERNGRRTAFTFIDLFSGIGGFRMALENNGGECLHFSEISTDAVTAYCENSNEPINKMLCLGNFFTLVISPKFLLIGSFEFSQ